MSVVLVVSCSKTHDTHPTPTNTRLYSVELLTHTNGGRVYDEKYTCFYDSQNRLSKLIFSSSDTSIINNEVFFTYNDIINKIYKTTYRVNDSTLLEVDSFLYNSSKQIVQEWTPIGKSLFSYNGKLLYEIVDSNNNYMIYSAHEGDFYKSSSSMSLDSAMTFVFNKSLNNRMGDYFQLRSFLYYGVDIYQNSHMITQIENTGFTINVNYVIDAYSKVVQTNMTKTDSLGNNLYITYNLTYENF